MAKCAYECHITALWAYTILLNDYHYYVFVYLTVPNEYNYPMCAYLNVLNEYHNTVCIYLTVPNYTITNLNCPFSTIASVACVHPFPLPRAAAL